MNLTIETFYIDKKYIRLFVYRELRDFHQRYESLVYTVKDKDDVIKELQNQLDARQSCKLLQF